ncbi:MAG: ATP-binding cassette domain-containing protein, partial [Myxococcales bacterium]|nr:ATP-binding cassette domain-containing protein [Myxococcales bacterium]
MAEWGDHAGCAGLWGWTRGAGCRRQGNARTSSHVDQVETLIRFTNVKKRFGPKVIYSGLDLSIRRGEAFTILGGSGVGKSVMLKMLIGLLTADSGSIVFDGQEITAMGERELSQVRQRIAMLFQSGALFDSLSVFENVAYGLEEHFREKMSRSEMEDRVAWALGLVGLPGVEEMRPADLSGGMRKRVGLARAIAVQPEVVLYDEPTTGL